jgi:cytochrome c oxidase assembly protein subunit 15
MLGAVLITAFTARLVWSVRGPASDATMTLSSSGRHRGQVPVPPLG